MIRKRYLSTLPAIVTCLLGIFAGLLLRNADVCDTRKVVYLISFGVGGVLLGLLWGTQFPIIKKIWTSSYVLVAGGCSAVLLGVFYWTVDVMQWRKWCQPFVWIGMNSITIYLANGFIVNFHRTASRMVGGDIQNFFNRQAQWIGRPGRGHHRTAARLFAGEFSLSKENLSAAVGPAVDILSFSIRFPKSVSAWNFRAIR